MRWASSGNFPFPLQHHPLFRRLSRNRGERGKGPENRRGGDIAKVGAANRKLLTKSSRSNLSS